MASNECPAALSCRLNVFSSGYILIQAVTRFYDNEIGTAPLGYKVSFTKYAMEAWPEAFKSVSTPKYDYKKK